MKKIVSFMIAFVLLLNSYSFASSNLNGNSITDYEYGSDGKQIKSVIDKNENSLTVTLYIDNILNSKTIFNYKENIIYEYKYDNNIFSKQNILNFSNTNFEVNKYSISDIINDNSIIKPFAYYPKPKVLSGWGLFGSYGKHPSINNTKPVDLYVLNYDEEPDSHIFKGKRLVFKPSMSPSTIKGLILKVVGIVSGGGGYAIAAKTILRAIGIATIDTAIDGIKYINADFSTQKILYRPVINNKIIFNDAYITKLWLIATNTSTKRKVVNLYDASYKSNRGHTPILIARNAQAAESTMRWYV